MTDPADATSPAAPLMGRKIMRLRERALMGDGGDEASSVRRQAVLLVESGQARQAVPLLRTLAEARPDDPKGWNRLIALLNSLGDWDGLIEALRRQVELGGASPTVLARLNMMIESRERPEEVMGAFSTPLEAGDFEGALEVIREGLNGDRAAVFGDQMVEWFATWQDPPDILARLCAMAAAKAAADDEVWAKARRTLDAVQAIAPELAAFRQDLNLRRDPPAKQRALLALLGRLEQLETPGAFGLPAREVAPLVEASWYHLARSAEHDPDAELTVLRRRHGVGRGEPPTVLQTARLLLRAGRRDEARDMLRAAIADNVAVSGDGDHAPLIRMLADAGDPDARKASERCAPATVPDGQDRGRLPASTVIFPHAHKTAGTSLHRGLGELFGQGAVRPGDRVGTQKALRHLPMVEKLRLDLISSHFSYDQAEDHLIGLLPKRPLYVGVVRDPVSRARSVYSFFGERYGTERQRESMLRAAYDPDINVVVERWLGAEDRWSSWRSDQCLIIGGQPAAADVIPVVEQRYLALVTPSGIGRLVATVARVLGVESTVSDHIKRSHSERFVIRPELQDRLRDFYAEDQQLHDWAKANEDRFIARAETWIAEEVAAAG